ncbi:hypothetical protein ACQ0QQ_12045 [Lysinibacillus sphaericus]
MECKTKNPAGRAAVVRPHRSEATRIPGYLRKRSLARKSTADFKLSLFSFYFLKKMRRYE